MDEEKNSNINAYPIIEEKDENVDSDGNIITDKEYSEIMPAFTTKTPTHARVMNAVFARFMSNFVKIKENARALTCAYSWDIDTDKVYSSYEASLPEDGPALIGSFEQCMENPKYIGAWFYVKTSTSEAGSAAYPAKYEIDGANGYLNLRDYVLWTGNRLVHIPTYEAKSSTVKNVDGKYSSKSGVDGLMSSTDKAYLTDLINAYWNKEKLPMYTTPDPVEGWQCNWLFDTGWYLGGIKIEALKNPTTPGNKHIPAGGSKGQILRWSADGTAVWGEDTDTTYSVSTETENGLMSKFDKKKVNHVVLLGAGTREIDITPIDGINSWQPIVIIDYDTNPFDVLIIRGNGGRMSDGIEMPDAVVYNIGGNAFSVYAENGAKLRICKANDETPPGRVPVNYKVGVNEVHTFDNISGEYGSVKAEAVHTEPIFINNMICASYGAEFTPAGHSMAIADLSSENISYGKQVIWINFNINDENTMYYLDLPPTAVNSSEIKLVVNTTAGAGTWERSLCIRVGGKIVYGLTAVIGTEIYVCAALTPLRDPTGYVHWWNISNGISNSGTAGSDIVPLEARILALEQQLGGISFGVNENGNLTYEKEALQ